MSLSRRGLLSVSAAGLAFSGFARFSEAAETVPSLPLDAQDYASEIPGYGPLVQDPKGLFDLPKGFSYTVVSKFGDPMSDGFVTPGKTDGMACFPLDKSRVILVRNHELNLRALEMSAFGPGRALADRLPKDRFFDTDLNGLPCPGGTTTLVYDLKKKAVERHHLSLAGTSTNCAGGATPWGSWLSCEETTMGSGEGVNRNHGWVFEVPASLPGVADPVPLKDMGRFRHEAAAVDPRTGVIYLTEDSNDGLGLLYRYLPNDREAPVKGGRLQALAFVDADMDRDSRNWGERRWSVGQPKSVRWIDLDGVDNPYEDLRWRGHERGAAWFARGEGIFFGQGELFFCCTKGGPTQLGQVMRYRPSPFEGKPTEADQPGQVEIFVEPADKRLMNMCDNVAIAPWGHLYICEDKEAGVNYLRGLTPDGRLYAMGRNAAVDPRDTKVNAELAGICFSPDGTTMFVNVYYPGLTLAITGPWSHFRR